MPDLADCIVLQEHLDDVETESRRAGPESAEVSEGGEREASALAWSNGGSGSGPVRSRAGFDFDEGERVAFAVAEDEVDLAAGGFEVGGEEFEALFLEVMLCREFTELTAQEVGGEGFGGQAVL